MSSEFAHGNEAKAEEMALHQKYLTLQGQMTAAAAEGDRQEVRRLTPLLERARHRWLKMNKRLARPPT